MKQSQGPLEPLRRGGRIELPGQNRQFHQRPGFALKIVGIVELQCEARGRRRPHDEVQVLPRWRALPTQKHYFAALAAAGITQYMRSESVAGTSRRDCGVASSSSSCFKSARTEVLAAK